MNKPLKRVKELQPFSKDHHHGLLLGWKIRTGIKKGVALERICAYTNWFYKNHLLPHFELEEKYIFPILDGHPLVLKAIEDHKAMRGIMQEECSEKSLFGLADLLEKHIRFEERELFQQIQLVATPAQLSKIEEVHNHENFTEFHDTFWTM